MTDTTGTTAAEDGTVKPNGLGTDGTIPNSPDGIAVGVTETPSHFNPEEDEEADS